MRNSTTILESDHSFLYKQAPIYAANNEKMENVQKLREEWTCKRPGSACRSTYRFVDPETNTHIPLGHEHFDAWEMAMGTMRFHIKFSQV
jgi:Cu/Ag efflux protein CusF